MKIEFVFIAQLASCLAMTGLIWLIQIVHYPTFKFVESSSFKKFNLFHQNRISFIVMPLMIIELVTASVLIYYLPNTIFIINLILTVLIFLSTAFLSVPLHQRLILTKSHEIIQKLVMSNWPRTIFWSARSLMLLFVLTRTLTNLRMS